MGVAQLESAAGDGGVLDLLLRVAGVRTPGGDWIPDAVVGIRHGRIDLVERYERIRGAEPAAADRLDWRDRWLMPAFVDSHTHLKRASLTGRHHLDLAGCTAVGDVLDAVAKAAALRRGDGWIQGDNLSPTALAEGRFPDRYELDPVSGDHPVVLRATGRHALVANSLALHRAGLDRTVVAPPGGAVERDGTGELTGVLHEAAKFTLDTTKADTVVPPVPRAERLDALAEGLAAFHAMGVAAIHEIPRSADELGDYVHLHNEGRLRTRVGFYIRAYETSVPLEHITGLGIVSGFGGGLLRVLGVKFSIDGSANIANAAIHGTYPTTGGSGICRLDRETLTDLLVTARRAGMAAAVHAIGDRALDIALDSFAEAGRRLPGSAPSVGSDRVEHAFVRPTPRRLERLASLGIVLSTQPAMLRSSAAALRHHFADDELAGFFPVRTALDAGCTVILNSDHPNGPAHPLEIIAAACTRLSDERNVVDPAEAVTVTEAVEMVTRRPYQVAGYGPRHGLVVPGAPADLVALSEPLDRIPPSRLGDVDVRHTIVGGDVVWSAA